MTRAGRWACGLLATLFLALLTVPWQPIGENPPGGNPSARMGAPIGEFDYSWMLVLHEAAANGWQFGRDIILPQGPLGFIGFDAYDPRTYWVVVGARTVIALAAGWAMWAVATALLPHPLLALPWLLAVIALMGRSGDHFFPVCSILLILTYFFANGRRLSGPAIALTALLAVASLIKVNQPFYATVAIGAVVLDQAVRRDRRTFVLPLTFAAVWLVLYFAARQSPSSLGPFLRGWWQITAGHTDGVHRPGPLTPVVRYFLVVAVALALLGVASWRRWRAAGLLPVAATLGVLMLVYKHSFMRQDAWHVHMAPMVVSAAAVLFAPVVWRSGRWAMPGGSVACIALALAVCGWTLARYTGEGLPGYAGGVARRVADNTRALASHVTDPGRVRREWDAQRQPLRAAAPLPVHAIEGPVDVYPYRQDVVFAHGLPLRPRPCVSSLVATSPALAELNAQHLRGPAAPRTVLFDVAQVDGVLPTILDGRSLPDLLALYDFADTSGAFMVMRRAAAPRAYRFTPLLRRTVGFAERVRLPEVLDAPLWVNIRFKRRAPGRVLSMLHKPPTLVIKVRTRDGDAHPYVLLPTLAGEHGFLLSPLIRPKERLAYTRLVERPLPPELHRATVTSFSVLVEDGWGEGTFEPELDVELRRLEFDPPARG